MRNYPKGPTKKLPAGPMGMKVPGDGSIKDQSAANSRVFGGSTSAALRGEATKRLQKK